MAWSRSGRAQLTEASNAGSASKFAALTENADAKEALDKIGGRLSGVYNIIHPQTKRILQAYASEENPPSKRAWCTIRRSSPLVHPRSGCPHD